MVGQSRAPPRRRYGNRDLRLNFMQQRADTQKTEPTKFMGNYHPGNIISVFWIWSAAFTDAPDEMNKFDINIVLFSFLETNRLSLRDSNPSTLLRPALAADDY